MLSFLKRGFLVIFLVCASAASGFVFADEQPFNGGGSHLPWPFPWADQCPVDWREVAGIYRLSEEPGSSKHMDLKITTYKSRGRQIVRMTRYNQRGLMVADGAAYVDENERVASVELHPIRRRAAVMRAEIRLHYKSGIMYCDRVYLTPVLSMRSGGSGRYEVTYYQLINDAKKKN
jgi:hypothetical protein